MVSKKNNIAKNGLNESTPEKTRKRRTIKDMCGSFMQSCGFEKDSLAVMFPGLRVVFFTTSVLFISIAAFFFVHIYLLFYPISSIFVEGSGTAYIYPTPTYSVSFSVLTETKEDEEDQNIVSLVKNILSSNGISEKDIYHTSTSLNRIVGEQTLADGTLRKSFSGYEVENVFYVESKGENIITSFDIISLLQGYNVVNVNEKSGVYYKAKDIKRAENEALSKAFSVSSQNARNTARTFNLYSYSLGDIWTTTQIEEKKDDLENAGVKEVYAQVRFNVLFKQRQ